jgi:hypothetical protein
MIINIQEKYNTIEQDLINNQSDVFLRYNYFTKKYKGDRLNDVNVGLFLDDNYQPVAQIFVRNKTGYIKKHLVFNREGNKILNTITLNNSFND